MKPDVHFIFYNRARWPNSSIGFALSYWMHQFKLWLKKLGPPQ